MAVLLCLVMQCQRHSSCQAMAIVAGPYLKSWPHWETQCASSMANDTSVAFSSAACKKADSVCDLGALSCSLHSATGVLISSLQPCIARDTVRVHQQTKCAIA